MFSLEKIKNNLANNISLKLGIAFFMFQKNKITKQL
jgi:hypothetical protein